MKEDRIAFDFESIPECKRLELVAIVYEEARKYIQKPGIREKFEQWQVQRKIRNNTIKAELDAMKFVEE